MTGKILTRLMTKMERMVDHLYKTHQSKKWNRMAYNLRKLLQLSTTILLRKVKEKDRYILMKRILIITKKIKMLQTLAS